MTKEAEGVRVRGLDTIDIESLARIHEKIGGEYNPELWDRRAAHYLRRDPDAAIVAEIGGNVVGFMLGEVRAGEFGLDETSGWIEVIGVDPDQQGKAVGRHLADAMVTRFKTRGVQVVRTLVDEKMNDIASFFTSVGFDPEPMRPFARRLD